MDTKSILQIHCKNFTQYALKLGITESWIRQLASGDAQPSKKLAMRIARVTETNLNFVDGQFDFTPKE